MDDELTIEDVAEAPLDYLRDYIDGYGIIDLSDVKFFLDKLGYDTDPSHWVITHVTCGIFPHWKNTITGETL